MSEPLRFDNPLAIRAEMARNGLTLPHLLPYEDAERGYVNPLDDHDTQVAVRAFLGRIWLAALHAERAALGGDQGAAGDHTGADRRQPGGNDA